MLMCIMITTNFVQMKTFHNDYGKSHDKIAVVLTKVIIFKSLLTKPFSPGYHDSKAGCVHSQRCHVLHQLHLLSGLDIGRRPALELPALSTRDFDGRKGSGFCDFFCLGVHVCFSLSHSLELSFFCSFPRLFLSSPSSSCSSSFIYFHFCFDLRYIWPNHPLRFP